MLLKGVWQPQWRERYADCFVGIAGAYFEHVSWEPRPALAARVAALLPGLMLARVDGKSPAEYLDTERARDTVRRFARSLLLAPVDHPDTIVALWREAAP